MQQRLHLLIVDRDSRAALAARYGTRWLLPSIRCAERARAGPLVVNWLAQLGAAGSFAGQWLGRFVPLTAAIDWLAVVDARATNRETLPDGLRWTPFDELRSSRSLLEYQQWAVDRVLVGDLPERPGPFGSLAWLDRVRAWTARLVGPLDSPPVCYRATPYEVVLGCSCRGRRVYVKGLTGDRIAEATVTAKLANEWPDAFAPTIAIETQEDGSAWWMTAECGGTPLPASMDKVASVVSTLARVQRTLADVAPALGLMALDLGSAVAWARELLANYGDSDQACASTLAAACESAGGEGVPRSWTPLDIDPGNVLVEGDRVRFIDLDRSYLAPAPLAIATLVRRLKRLPVDPIDLGRVNAIRRRYGHGWRPRMVGRRWRDFETASAVVDCHHGWQRLVQNVERGEVSGPLDVAAERTAQRLARAANARHASR